MKVIIKVYTILIHFMVSMFHLIKSNKGILSLDVIKEQLIKKLLPSILPKLVQTIVPRIREQIKARCPLDDETEDTVIRIVEDAVIGAGELRLGIDIDGDGTIGSVTFNDKPDKTSEEAAAADLKFSGLEAGTQSVDTPSDTPADTPPTDTPKPI